MEKKQSILSNVEKQRVLFAAYYITWFAPAIPMDLGPYKFQGLPGLIVEAYDVEKKWTFQLQEISYQDIANKEHKCPINENVFALSGRTEYARLIK